MQVLKSRDFANGSVHAIRLDDGFLIETTDTFLPFYTKDAIGRKQNSLDSYNLGSRAERWMCGVSIMSGCPVRCKFCATGNMKKFRNLTYAEIVDQVQFVLMTDQKRRDKEFIDNIDKYVHDTSGGNGMGAVDMYKHAKEAQEFKINYTRMGEPFLNIDNVREAIKIINKEVPNTHHYISTIGIKGSDFSWIEGNTTLQISLHSLDEEKRNWLIPFRNKMSIEELGQIRTKSNLKTTLNLTLVDESDFDIEKLKRYFDPDYFFIKLSPINENEFSEENHLGKGIIQANNLM